jgi:hypothetical protein
MHGAVAPHGHDRIAPRVAGKIGGVDWPFGHGDLDRQIVKA